MLIFAKAKVSQAKMVDGALELFYRASGLHVSLEKSRALVSPRVSQGMKDRVFSVTTIPFTWIFHK